MDKITRNVSLIVNNVSLAGLAIIAISLANIVFLLIIDTASGSRNPYFGVISFLILPVVVAMAAGLILLGVLREYRRRRKLAPDIPVEMPRIVSRLRASNPLLITAALVGLGVMLSSSLLTYQAYQFTESANFCGQTCHVMRPEYAAYQNSPHARVACADCHVGPGTSWYFRSKISGIRQILAVAMNDFPRPIPSPVENLRPAQHTCEGCHWPAKFYDGKLKVFNHYAYDEENSHRQIRMLIKIGGGSPTTGLSSGIHWHMNVDNQISYYAADKERQDIPYVRVKDSQGRNIEYLRDGAKGEDFKNARLRKMDCIDCHNRPTHIFESPDRAVDDLLFTKTIDASLPFIKQHAVDALTREYKTTEEGVEGIATYLGSTYEAKYPEVFRDKGASVTAAIAAVQGVFRVNMAPEMNLDWRKHPDNLGHFNSLGCFRCHDGLHISGEGRKISRDCNSCHTILVQKDGEPASESKPAEFRHPGGEMDFSEANCNSCHTGES